MPDDSDNRPAARPIRIGDTAPDFIARSTAGPVRLSDYRGRWLLFFSHPGDFTPVCTSEFLAIARAADRFAALDCVLLAHSVDSLFSHLAWIRALRDDLGVAIPFPIVEDPSLEIAHAFGMVDAQSFSAATVRAAFFIDPDGVVRALQRTSDGSAMTPEGWQPGDDLLVPPELAADGVLAADNPTGWFYTLASDGRAR